MLISYEHVGRYFCGCLTNEELDVSVGETPTDRKVYDGFYRQVNFPSNFFANSLVINPSIANDIESVEVLYGDASIPL